jgi:hypothetical protein
VDFQSIRCALAVRSDVGLGRHLVGSVCQYLAGSGAMGGFKDNSRAPGQST